MKAIILGGTGFIGSELTRCMLRKGWDVVIPSRSPEKYKERGLFSAYGEVEYALWDAKSATGLAEIIAGADAVVNLVGESVAAGPWTEERKSRIRDSRIQAGQAVTQAVAEASARPKVLVQGSAVGFYGSRGDAICTEHTAPPHPGVSFLADTARDWEASTAGVEAKGVRRVVVRTGMVLDVEGGALEQFMAPFRFFLGGRIGSGKQWISWIHRRDQAQAIVFCIENSACKGVYNFTAPEAVTNAQFSKILGRVMGRPSWLRVPELPLKLLLGEMARELVLSGQRVVPERLRAQGYSFTFPELRPALLDIVQRMR